MADEVWESYRLELERLYIRENKSLKKVMEYMKSKYSFDERKSQYEKYFGRWAFRKNQSLTPSEGRFIGRRINKRKREYQKESEVFKYGVQYPPHKLKKAVYGVGKAFVSTIDRVPDAPSPDTPEGIVVCTPATPGVRLEWSASLPWLRFSRLLQLPGQNDGLPSLSSIITVASPTDVITNRGDPEILHRLGTIVPWNMLTHPPNINSSSRTATGLSILMPEENNGQHRSLATKLCSSQATPTETQNVELFLISNNLTPDDANGIPWKAMAAHDRRVIEMFRKSGWHNIEKIKILLAIQETTAGAIVEKAFASALRLLRLDTVEMMLKAGMDPNSLVGAASEGPLTPLQFAAKITQSNLDGWNEYYRYFHDHDDDDGEDDHDDEDDEDDHDDDDDHGFHIYHGYNVQAVKLVELLLRYEADINLTYNGKCALQYAIGEKNGKVIRKFLSHGAIVTPLCLETAASNVRDVNLFCELLSPDTDVNARSGLQGLSALAQAALCNNLPILKCLISKGADMDALFEIELNDDWGVTTVLGLAISEGNHQDIHKVVEALLQARTNFNPKVDGYPYISPLTLAVSEGDTIITKLLLQAGFDIQIADDCSKLTLLERALVSQNKNICKMLIGYGARVNRPLSDEGQELSALLLAVELNDFDIINLLIRSGARLNDVYSNPPGTVFAAAIEQGNLALMHFLESVGEITVGPMLRRIGSLETAAFLQQRGILHNICNTCGARVLLAATRERNDDLALFLLGYDFDVGESITLGHTLSYFRTPLRTPLQAAIRIGNLSITEAILTRGAKVTDYDLTEAIDQQDTGLLQHLLTGFTGSAPTAVGLAIILNKPDILQLMLDKGVDPKGIPQPLGKFQHQSSTSNGLRYYISNSKSVLDIAIYKGYKSIMQILLRSHPWAPELTGHALTLAIFLQHAELVEDLLEQELDWNQEMCILEPDEEGDYSCEVFLTPLQVAVRSQQVSIVRKLIERPTTNINHLGEGVSRRTALQIAVENGNMELINLLLDHGADINGAAARDGGATALQIAAIKGYLGIARMLIDLGADIDAAPAKYNGRTALEGAAERGRIDMLQLLLSEGASLVGEDGERQYREAVKLARRNGHNAAARLVESFKTQMETGAASWV